MSTMATPQPHTGSVGPDTLITCKVLIEGTNRRFKLALRDLGAHILPQKLRFLLAVPPECIVTFDRFSDSAAAYISLDSANPAVYKQLYRAAKAKLKLRLRATVIRPASIEEAKSLEAEEHNATAAEQSTLGAPRHSSYLETVLSPIPVPAAEAEAESSDSIQSSNPIPCSYPETNDTPKPTARASFLSRPTLPSLTDFSSNAFSIDCNACDKSIPNEHYHCSICMRGDFDLCQACVDNGETCHGDDHWLIKRSIKNGRIHLSTTETVPPKKTQQPTSPSMEHLVTTAFDEEERTCNSCINQYPASSFVTCKACPDFDLCFVCFQLGEHGHHPGHVFQPVDGLSSPVSATVRKLCSAGRNLHHDAICDGCDKQIIGVRSKCLTCPDFDYCSTCVVNAAQTHSLHRFASLYEQLPAVPNYFLKAVHKGICCDGPLCANRARKTWIRGDRYKCAICHDTDFCASCEALPTFNHNKTHPLIKMKTPVNFAHVSVVNDDAVTGRSVQLGDRPVARNAATETVRPSSANAATQVQTVAEVKPTDVKTDEQAPISRPGVADLQALFMSDSTPDGSTFAPNHLVSQSWTLRNPGQLAWPAGCAVYFTGGDEMRNLDMKHPSSVDDMTIANRSNILEHAVEPGQTAVFTVMLRSPPRECRAISYWRLKTADGEAFGHKLWVDITVANKTVEAPKESVAEAPVPDVFQAEEISESQDSSIMIFPKLEKESPAASLHELSKVPKAVAEITEEDEHQDLIEDIESLKFDDDENTEDGFMTDEEYDILDAEDEDFLDSAHRAATRQDI